VTEGQPGRPKRRTFTAAYKAHSHFEHWRHQQQAGTLPATSGKPAKSAETQELARLRAENKKLKARNDTGTRQSPELRA